jgi:hypothetical protein
MTNLRRGDKIRGIVGAICLSEERVIFVSCLCLLSPSFVGMTNFGGVVVIENLKVMSAMNYYKKSKGWFKIKLIQPFVWKIMSKTSGSARCSLIT